MDEMNTYRSSWTNHWGVLLKNHILFRGFLLEVSQNAFPKQLAVHLLPGHIETVRENHSRKNIVCEPNFRAQNLVQSYPDVADDTNLGTD